MDVNPKDTTRLETQHRTLLILWVAFLSSIVMYFFLTFIMPREETDTNRILTIVFSAIAVFLTGVSFVVKKKFFSRAIDEQQPRLINTGFILAAAFCEAGALFGLVDFLVAHDRYYFLPIGVAFLGLLLHFPKRNDLEAASFKKIS